MPDFVKEANAAKEPQSASAETEPTTDSGGGGDDGGGGDGGDGGDGKGGGGDSGKGGDDDDDDEKDESDDDDVNPEDITPRWSPLAALRVSAATTQLALESFVNKSVKLWVTRDPSMTSRLFFFTVMGVNFLIAASLLGPQEQLDFARDSLFNTVMGTTPQWIFNRNQGPIQATFLTSAAACVAAIAKIRLGNNMVPLSPFMHGVLGLPVGLMLVFRWNNAYDRWWSGRTELGHLLIRCKNLGGMFCTWVAPFDQQLATRALALLCALKECVADRLNGTQLPDGTVMLNATSLSTPLHPDDLEGLFNAENKVLFCIEMLRKCIFDAHKQTLLPPPILGGMNNEDLYGIIRAYGECEKVVMQPPPGCIISHLKSTLMVYVCTLPFILVHEVGAFAVVPTTALLSLALFGTEAAAEQIEQPFGNRPYHLPVRGLIINNTRDLGQTSRPVLGFSGYVNSPRDFSDTQSQYTPPTGYDPYAGGSGIAGDGPLETGSGPLLYGAADAWDEDAAGSSADRGDAAETRRGKGDGDRDGDRGGQG